MTIETILYITLALLLALGFSFFQYLYKSKRSRKNIILAILRFLSVFIILLLLINPKISADTTRVIKPVLYILADDSQSINHLKVHNVIQSLQDFFRHDDELKSSFEVQEIKFSDRIYFNDSLKFSGKRTNVYEALNSVTKLNSRRNSAIILVSDGNQNIGRDYRFFKPLEEYEIYPLIVGDTTAYEDVYIDRINVNEYAFLDNKFPVEIFTGYLGTEEREVELKIRLKDRTILNKKIHFNKENKSNQLTINLPASSIGLKNYEVSLSALNIEKNTLNNVQNFSIEVIDERSSVLILTDIHHPDLGALKKSIESNEQRTAVIKNIDQKDFTLSDYQLVILYQINRRFKGVLEKILKEDYNFFLVTGTQTDWNFINTLDLGFSKQAISAPQEIFPVYNEQFSKFQFENIGFSDFPPVVEKFGELTIDKNKFPSLLDQKIEGVKTGEPMLVVSNSKPKIGLFIGENIWRWRAKSYLDSENFQAFDDFIGGFIQNLSMNQKNERLSIDAEKLYYTNDNVIIRARYFDENLEFDPNANLTIKISSLETGEITEANFVSMNSFYEMKVGNLPAGTYNYSVSNDKIQISRSGSFNISDFNAEEQKMNADLEGMMQFASRTENKLYFPDQAEDLKRELLNSDKFKALLKTEQKSIPLIDWYYLLFLLILVLAAEWFYRKYLGLI